MTSSRLLLRSARRAPRATSLRQRPTCRDSDDVRLGVASPRTAVA